MFILQCQSMIRTFVRHRHIFIDRYDLASTGILLKEFQQRRQTVIELIRHYLRTERQISTANFTICLPSATQLFMGPDVTYYPFKQQSDFYYLTGCMQPDSLVLFNIVDQTVSSHLFLSPCTMNSLEDYQRWFGPITTDRDEICQTFGVDHVNAMDQLLSVNPPASSILFYSGTSMNDPSIQNKHFRAFVDRFSSSLTCDQLNSFLHSLRSIKSSGEQAILRQVCQLTSQAFIQTLQQSPKTVSNEREIKARFQYECEKLDEISLAFNPVVAAQGR